MFSLRLGSNPRCIITTTPKPNQLVTSLTKRNDVYITTGNTFENADNLAESTLAMLRERYEGTNLGRQELYAEIIEDIEGALWNNRIINDARLPKSTKVEFSKICVGIHPAVTSNANSDETGIVVVAKDFNNKYYLLDDKSGKYSPDGWGRLAIDLYHRYSCNLIVAEINNGGDLVERLLKSIDQTVKYRAVHASRGKMLRAEPISALYEQGKVHHLGVFPELESQMCTYTGESKPSPDRLDALVWGLTELSKSRGDVSWRIS